MSHIEIRPPWARLCAVVLWLTGLFLIGWQPTHWGREMQLLWSAALWLSAWRTAGIVPGAPCLAVDARGWQLRSAGQVVPLLAVRPGIVSRHLTSGVLITPNHRYALLVFGDSLPPDQHRRLCRLLVDGVKPVQEVSGRGV